MCAKKVGLMKQDLPPLPPPPPPLLLLSLRAKQSETERPECGSGHFIVCASCKKERWLKKNNCWWEKRGRELHEGKRKKRVGTECSEPSDSCVHVVVGDGLSVCQSRYFCLFSAALLAARDSPCVITGCLLSLAKKERGVCAV